MTDGQERQKGDWKYFLGFMAKFLGYFALWFGVAFAMFWIRRHMIPHR